jgi:ubiquinone/menaquinone biosynthesis C-methylase UbiE
MAERRLSNRARYDGFAAGYEALVRFGSLGQFGRFYRAVAGELDESPGETILDLGCGPGTLVPYLLEKVGSAGRVIGIDEADGMVARARSCAARAGWHNVAFERASALDYAPGTSVQAIVFCLSLSTMGDAKRCLDHVVPMLKPGGQLVILDSIPERSRRLASLVMRLKAPLVGAHPTGVPLEYALAHLEGVRLRRFFLGVYSLLSARRPGGVPRDA